jgi:hypothetical protein
LAQPCAADREHPDQFAHILDCSPIDRVDIPEQPIQRTRSARFDIN